MGRASACEFECCKPSVDSRSLPASSGDMATARGLPPTSPLWPPGYEVRWRDTTPKTGRVIFAPMFATAPA